MVSQHHIRKNNKKFKNFELSNHPIQNAFERSASSFKLVLRNSSFSNERILFTNTFYTLLPLPAISREIESEKRNKNAYKTPGLSEITYKRVIENCKIRNYKIFKKSKKTQKSHTYLYTNPHAHIACTAIAERTHSPLPLIHSLSSIHKKQITQQIHEITQKNEKKVQNSW